MEIFPISRVKESEKNDENPSIDGKNYSIELAHYEVKESGKFKEEPEKSLHKIEENSFCKSLAKSLEESRERRKNSSGKSFGKSFEKSIGEFISYFSDLTFKLLIAIAIVYLIIMLIFFIIIFSVFSYGIYLLFVAQYLTGFIIIFLSLMLLMLWQILFRRTFSE